MKKLRLPRSAKPETRSDVMQKVTTGEVSFALGIEAYSPQRSEDLQRKARPDEGGERPKQKLSLHTIPAMMVN